MEPTTREDLERALSELAREVRDPRAGIHGPGSVSWEIDREGVLFVAGGRAALLQLAHPFVAAAVDEHSATRHDVRGRFQRTFVNVYAMVFGDLDAAIRAARRVHAVHERVHGTLRERVGSYAAGTRYHANDPETQLWVYATLVDSALVAFERTVRRLSNEERDLYIEEGRRFARLFAIPDEMVPRDHAAFRRYFEDMLASGRLAVSEAGASLARFLMAPPTRAHAPVARVLRAVTAALLPPTLREPFGLGYELRDRALAGAALRALRPTYRALPRRLRDVPAYVEAERRARGEPPVDRFGRAVERLLLRAVG